MVESARVNRAGSRFLKIAASCQAAWRAAIFLRSARSFGTCRCVDYHQPLAYLAHTQMLSERSHDRDGKHHHRTDRQRQGAAPARPKGAVARPVARVFTVARATPATPHTGSSRLGDGAGDDGGRVAFLDGAARERARPAPEAAAGVLAKRGKLQDLRR